MRLLMALSKDGFVAADEHDPMLWTGEDDKLAFKLLTMVGNGRERTILGAGWLTARLMPILPGRIVVPLSRDPAKGIPLEHFAQKYPEGWLIGGQTVALAALYGGLLTEVFLSICPTELRTGVAEYLRLGLRHRGWGPVRKVQVGETVIERWVQGVTASGT